MNNMKICSTVKDAQLGGFEMQNLPLIMNFLEYQNFKKFPPYYVESNVFKGIVSTPMNCYKCRRIRFEQGKQFKFIHSHSSVPIINGLKEGVAMIFSFFDNGPHFVAMEKYKKGKLLMNTAISCHGYKIIKKYSSERNYTKEEYRGGVLYQFEKIKNDKKEGKDFCRINSENIVSSYYRGFQHGDVTLTLDGGDTKKASEFFLNNEIDEGWYARTDREKENKLESLEGLADGEYVDERDEVKVEIKDGQVTRSVTEENDVTWKNGHLNGKMKKLLYGKVQGCEYRNGYEEGIEFTKEVDYERTMTYKAGIKHGAYSEIDGDFKNITGTYKDGKRDQLWKYKIGDTVGSVEYQDGELHGEHCFSLYGMDFTLVYENGCPTDALFIGKNGEKPERWNIREILALGKIVKLE